MEAGEIFNILQNFTLFEDFQPIYSDEGMSGINTIPLALRLDVDAVTGSVAESIPNSEPDPETDLSMDLLDVSSLHTVLAMLEVIDSVEDLALLETLSIAQKRQVWDATPKSTRLRLKQLRMRGFADAQPPDLVNSATLHSETLNSVTLIEAADLLPENRAIEETAAVDLQTQQEEIDLMLQEPLNLAVRPTLAVGDWIVLQAKPKLTKAELNAIWEVIELQGNYAHILTQGLGTRNYPTSWMLLYPKPIDYAEPEF